MVTGEKRRPDYFISEPVYGERLPLPSFGMGVTKSAPRMVTVPAGSSLYDVPYVSGDALSISYLSDGGTLSPADQDFLPLDVGFLLGSVPSCAATGALIGPRPSISRASEGVAGSCPSSRMIRTVRSTSCSLVANSPLA